MADFKKTHLRSGKAPWCGASSDAPTSREDLFREYVAKMPEMTCAKCRKKLLVLDARAPRS